MYSNATALSGQPELQLWDLNHQLRMDTEDLKVMDGKMHAMYTQQEGNSKATLTSSEYWKQIQKRVGVSEGFGTVAQQAVHADPLKREQEKQIQNKLKLIDMSPHLQNSELSQFHMSEDQKQKGVTARRNKEIFKQQNDPFWDMAGREGVKSNTSKAIEHIKTKFQSDINRITDDLVESAQQTELGREIVRDNVKVQKSKSRLRGDVALFHLNQNLIELEQLQHSQALNGNESRFIRNKASLEQQLEEMRVQTLETCSDQRSAEEGQPDTSPVPRKSGRSERRDPHKLPASSGFRRTSTSHGPGLLVNRLGKNKQLPLEKSKGKLFVMNALGEVGAGSHHEVSLDQTNETDPAARVKKKSLREEKRQVKAYLRNPRQRLIEQERQSTTLRSTLMQEKRQPITLTAHLKQFNRLPVGAPRQVFSSSLAEGFEGTIDGMIQGTFQSVDNEIDKQDFDSRMKTAARDAIDDYQSTQQPKFPEASDSQFAFGSEVEGDDGQMQEVILVPSQKRSMTARTFSAGIAPRRYADTLAKLKLQPGYQKQLKQRQIQTHLFKDTDRYPNDRIKFTALDRAFREFKEHHHKQHNAKPLDIEEQQLAYQNYHVDKVRLENRAKRAYKVEKVFTFEYKEAQNAIYAMIQMETGFADGGEPDDLRMQTEHDHPTSESKGLLSQRTLSVGQFGAATALDESDLDQSFDDASDDRSATLASVRPKKKVKSQNTLTAEREIEKGSKMIEDDHSKQMPVNDPDLYFYEENLDQADYDKEMIEELFDKMKFRFNKHSDTGDFGTHFMSSGSAAARERKIDSDESEAKITDISEKQGEANELGYGATATDEDILGGFESPSLRDEEEEEATEEWEERPVYNLKRRGGFLDGEENASVVVLPKIGNGKGQIKLASHLSTLANMGTSVKSAATGISSIEYFHKPKDKKGNTEGMGLLEKVHAKTTKALERKKPLRVRAEEAKYDELGMVNFYGYVSKRRAGLNSFHDRWMVLRGLELYWYRNVDDQQQKGISILPAKPIQTDFIVGSTKCFVVEKENEEKSSRRLVFEDADNLVMREFKAAITMMTNLKMYIETTIRLKEKIDPSITEYLTIALNQDSILFKDIDLNAEHRITPILDQLQCHSQLTRLTLSNCGLGDTYFQVLLDLLAQQNLQIEHLDVTQNDLTQNSMRTLNQFISAYSLSRELVSLVLDKNDLGNEGFRELANGLIERFNAMEKDNNAAMFMPGQEQTTLNYIQMPIHSLSFSDTGVTDYGFKYFLQRIETIYLRMVQTNREIESGMHLDISDNRLSDTSIRFLAELLGKFSGFRSVNMSNLSQKTKNAENTGYIELAKALKENTSLVELDLRKNSLSDKEISGIFAALSENFVLSDLKLEVRQRKLPVLFSSYPLQSMYEFYHSIENIDLLTHQM